MYRKLCSFLLAKTDVNMIWLATWVQAQPAFLYKTVFLMIVSLFFLISPQYTYAAPGVSAQAAILIENSTGRVLYNKNADVRLPMASTTKIMTAICALEHSNPDTMICVADGAVGIEGSSIYLAKDEKITIRDLLYGMMLNSGNDAATALALEISGSVEEFAKLMTQTAKNIGAKNTNFVNACGLYEDEHYTTASDLAIISAYAMKNPDFAEIVSTRQMKISNGDKGYPRVLKNHNRLLGMYDGCIGVKTGYTKKCGRCLVSCAMRDGVMLTCVTLNAPDDWNDHMSLMDYGFSLCCLKTVASEGDYCRTVSVEQSIGGVAKVSFKDSLSYVAVDGFSDEVSVSYSFLPELKAPLSEGQSVGTAQLFVSGTPVATSELICLGGVPLAPKKGFGELLFNNIKSFFSLYSFS